MALSQPWTGATYFPHTWWRCLLWGLCTPIGWEVKSQLGAWACLQTSNNMDYTWSWQSGWHCRLALSQPGVLASWPFCPLPASQPFTLWFDVISPRTIGLWLVQCGLQFLHTEECTHFINDAAHKVSNPIAQEPGQGPKDQDVTLIEELSNCFSCLIGGHICHNMLCEMVLQHQDIGNARQLVQLHGCLYAGKIYVKEVQ